MKPRPPIGPRLAQVHVPPEDAAAHMVARLRSIVRAGDGPALEDWINRYMRSTRIALPIPVPVKEMGDYGSGSIDCVKETEMRIIGRMGISLAGAAIWSEALDVAAAQKVRCAEIFFLDVLGAFVERKDG